MDNTTLIELAQYQARVYGLDGALVCAVVEQESNWNQWAIRYEPAFYTRYVAPQVNLPDTERHARAISWGLMQTMGQVARERGFKEPYLSSLCDPTKSLTVGCEFLAHLMALHNNDSHASLLAWNGGGNPEYPDQVLARRAKYLNPSTPPQQP